MRSCGWRNKSRLVLPGSGQYSKLGEHKVHKEYTTNTKMNTTKVAKEKLLRALRAFFVFFVLHTAFYLNCAIEI